MPSTADSTDAGHLTIGPLAERQLPDARHIMRTAFGTFVGAPNLETFWTDRDYAYGRWRAPHVASIGAALGGDLVGSNFVTRLGSVGVFGPLSVRPDLQERGIAKALLAATMDRFATWGTTHNGLFTFPHSPKHLALYQKFGFHARFLTAVMSAPARGGWPIAGASRFSELNPAARADALRLSREVTDTIYPGFDLSNEIAAVHVQGLGDTVLLDGAGGLGAFAICHYGPDSEAGEGCCLVKFAAVRATPSAPHDFPRQIDACEALAASVGMPRVLAGANLARHEAYQHLVARGYRTMFQGVAMHQRNEPGYCRPGVYVIDDWR